MKKLIGLTALVAAGAYALYKIGKEEATEEDKIVHEPISEEDLKNPDFKADLNEETEPAFTSESYPNLSEADIVKITSESEAALKQLEASESDEERPIQHTVSFDNEIDREDFKNTVISQGYVITSGENGDIIILHISKPDQDDILAKVFYLADLTKSHNGTYKGWEIK